MKKLFSKKAIANSFSEAAKTYDQAAFMQKEVGQHLLERCDLIHYQPTTILDIGSGTGHLSQLLQKKYPKATVIASDISLGMLQYAKSLRWFDKKVYTCLDAECLPFADNSVDMIFSNMVFHWCEDMPALFKEIARVLHPDGFILFSTLGPDSYKELRQSWQAADENVHVHDFIDMHHVGDCMLQTGFTDPVMDREELTITYQTVMQIMRELKAVGAHNLDKRRHMGLTGKNKLQQMRSQYDTLRDENNRLPLTFEVVYGHAFAPKSTPTSSLNQSGEVRISLADLKRELK